MTQNAKNRPVKQIRYGGVKALVWRNETQNGPMYNVTVGRLYREGEEWKTSSSFNVEDLPALAKALLDAHTWVHELADAERVAPPEDDPQSEEASSPSRARSGNAQAARV